MDRLKNRIKFCLKNVDVKVVQTMVSGVYRKLDSVRRAGERKDDATI